MGSPYLQTIKSLLLEVGKLCAERGVILPALLLAGVCAGACANAGSTPVFQERKKQRLLWRRETRMLKVTVVIIPCWPLRPEETLSFTLARGICLRN